MRGFKTFSHIKAISGLQLNFSNLTNSKPPTIIINIIKPNSVKVNHSNEPTPIRKNEKIRFDDLSRKELYQILDFVV